MPPGRAPWTVICFSAPAEPSGLRVYVWRALKELGAVALGGGVYAFPATDELTSQAHRLAERVLAGGGSAFLLRAEALDEPNEAAIMARIAEVRAEEYAQVAKSARKFHEHVEREAATDDYRFSELESLEEELEKVRRQFQRVVERDYFPSGDGRSAASEAITRAQARLATYAEVASQREG